MSAADAMRTIAAVRVVKPGVLLRKWSDGTQALVDLARALSATGRDDTRAFLEWRMPHGLSLTKAAEALGLSRRMVAYNSNGEKPVPRPILLACKGREAEQAA